jgi:hypothetical protein
MRDILTRLELLEASRRQDPLILLCVDGAGNQKNMTVSEMLQSDYFGFVRVASGSSLKDLDRLLMAFHDKAIQAFEGGADDG